MTTPPPIPIDPVTVAIAVATALFGSTFGEAIGAYAVIFLGAVLGGAWATSRRNSTGRMHSMLFLCWVVGVALLVTVPAAALLQTHAGIEQRWLLGPLAAVIAGVGDEWGPVIRWAWAQVRARFATGGRQ